jgi:tetrahydromethanopterin S-methyltransferase subunit C
LFFSRAPQIERWGVIVLMIAGSVATSRVIDKSIATGAMGFLFVMCSIPVLSLALVAWAVATQRLSEKPRRAAMVATVLLACGVWTLLRTNGLSGKDSDFRLALVENA